MGKITVEVKINTFGTMLYSLNHPNMGTGQSMYTMYYNDTYLHSSAV